MSQNSAILKIDRQALRANYDYLQSLCEVPLCAVLKADAYGIGAAVAAEIFKDAGCRLFFTAHLQEALDLRKSSTLDAIRIAVLNGPHRGEEGDYQRHRIIPVLNSWEQIMRYQHYAQTHDQPLEAFIHFDSGMNRLGVRADESARIIDNPNSVSFLHITAMLSHLACAEEQKSPYNAQQLENFYNLKARLPFAAPVIFANSAGIFLDKQFHCDGVKPGAALYGIHRNLFCDLRNVVTLDAPIVQIAPLKKGATSGYNATFTAAHDMITATVACGYADGYLRNDNPASKRSARFAQIHQQKAPLIGRVSMDLLVFDVTEIVQTRPVNPGERMVLFGSDYDINALAADCDTIAYELLTSIGKRVKRKVT